MDDHEYEQIVNSFYEPTYRFALSLARNSDDACELTQETFARLLTKGRQLRDRSKARAWLFTTLYRISIGWKRREANLPHFEISLVEEELPPVNPATVDQLDGSLTIEALFELDERYRAPLMLFYLEEHGYREIAEILDIPVGTVMSRLARGKAVLRQVLGSKAAGADAKIVPVEQRKPQSQ